MPWTLLVAASKNNMSPQQFAVHFFNKQARLKRIDPTDKEYSLNLVLKQDAKKGLWGYVDSRDKWIIKPVFEQGYEFEKDSCAIVKFNGYWGVIDRTQSFCIVPICTEIHRSASREGLFMVSCPEMLLDEYDTKSYSRKRDKELLPVVDESNVKYIYWKQDGSPLCADRYATISDFDGRQRAIVSTEKGYGLLRDDGTYVYNPYFTDMQPYADGMYKVKEHDCYGLVSHDGRSILSIAYDYIDPWTSDRAIWIRQSQGDQKWGATDSEGNIIVLPRLDTKPSFASNAIQIVTADGKYGILSKDGKFLCQCNDDYIEYADNRYWTSRNPQHCGYYKINEGIVNYIEFPQITGAGQGKNALAHYRNKYASAADSRLWLNGLTQASYYSPLFDEKQSSFLFESQAQKYELLIQWQDTVALQLKDLETRRVYPLHLDRPIGLFVLDNEGNRREMYSNEYVFGTYDFDRDGVEELVIAMRDNSINGWHKDSGACYGVLKIGTNGNYRWLKNTIFSDEPIGHARLTNGSISSTPADVTVPSGYPRIENFGLKGPVMTTGDLSFNYDGYLTKIGGYHIIYDSDTNPRLAEDYGDGRSTRNYVIARFDRRAIVISFETDYTGGGDFQGSTASDIWTFNSQGLLESSYHFAFADGGGQQYYVYDENGCLMYEIESLSAMSCVTEYLLEAEQLDSFGNWTERQTILYDERAGRSPQESHSTRVIEYYIESESGK